MVIVSLDQFFKGTKNMSDFELNGFMLLEGLGRVTKVGLVRSEKNPEYYDLFLGGFQGGSVFNSQTQKSESQFHFVKVKLSEGALKYIKDKLVPNAYVFISGSPTITPYIKKDGSQGLDITIAFPNVIKPMEKVKKINSDNNYYQHEEVNYNQKPATAPYNSNSTSDDDDWSNISSDDIPF